MADNEALNRRLENLEEDSHQGSLRQRVERLERILNDPEALLRRALQLLEEHRELVVVGAMAGAVVLCSFSDADSIDCPISLFC